MRLAQPGEACLDFQVVPSGEGWRPRHSWGRTMGYNAYAVGLELRPTVAREPDSKLERWVNRCLRAGAYTDVGASPPRSHMQAEGPLVPSHALAARERARLVPSFMLCSQVSFCPGSGGPE